MSPILDLTGKGKRRAHATLGQHVAAELRAEMARRQPRVTNRALAEYLGKDESWISRRLGGHYDLTLTEADSIARALGMTVAELVETWSPPEPDGDPSKIDAAPATGLEPVTYRLPIKDARALADSLLDEAA